MKILAGLSHKKLAKGLSKELGCQYVEVYTTTFDDSEIRVQILDDLHNCEVIIIQSTSKPVNDHLMELLLLIDIAKRAGASGITAIMPYFGYSRQDRRSYDFAPISARLVADLLEIAGVDRLITVDLHSPQLEGFFKVAVQNLTAVSLFASIINNYNNATMVSPDVGGFVRTGIINSLFNMDIAVINKSRNIKNECQMSDIIGKVQGKPCILIDDIVDSGRTLCQGAELLMQQGALSVDAFITHAVLSGSSKEDIEGSNISNIYITDTIEAVNLSPKFHVISIIPLIAATLKK